MSANFHWKPTSEAGLPRGLRCDAWPHDITGLDVLSNGRRPPYGQASALSWVLPRDCPAAARTPANECKFNYFMRVGGWVGACCVQ